MGRKYTEARKENNRKWDTANLDRVSLAFPKGQKDTIKAAAALCGESVNAYILGAVRDKLEGRMVDAPAGVLQLSPEYAAKIKQHAAAFGLNEQRFLQRAVEQQIERDRRAVALGVQIEQP